MNVVNLREYIVDTLKPYVHAFQRKVQQEYSELANRVSDQETTLDQLQSVVADHSSHLAADMISVTSLDRRVTIVKSSLATEEELTAAQTASRAITEKAMLTLSTLHQLVSEDYENVND